MKWHSSATLEGPKSLLFWMDETNWWVFHLQAASGAPQSLPAACTIQLRRRFCTELFTLSVLHISQLCEPADCFNAERCCATWVTSMLPLICWSWRLKTKACRYCETIFVTATWQPKQLLKYFLFIKTVYKCEAGCCFYVYCWFLEIW